uniref:Helokinestatin-1 n=2 Tax=Heloderma TaxID=8550 RepID=HKS_HELHO|nr:RecName: Full=Helokinestatin-1 [Heloderma suspectum suspectum]P86447.1 RecName: Full=Helokinestatin-1; AltName: Full=Helokinestatin [Heloderma horridum horridum]
GPPYQPLVPR